VSHSRKSAAQRAKSLERLRAFQAQQAQTPAPAAPPAPPPPNPFDTAYSGHQITPEAAVWDDRGYVRWTLPVHTPRNAFPRS
jgi:hypothetical protein